MKMTWSLLAAASLVSLTAQATPVRLDGHEMNLQQILNGVTQGGVSSVNVVTDQVNYDAHWTFASPSNSGAAMIQIEIAGYANQNRFGLYDVSNPNSRVELFSGAQGAGALTSFGIGADGRVYRNSVDSGMVFNGQTFGFYLETPAGLWRSDSSLNGDAADHMVAYRGENDVITSPLGHLAFWDTNTYLLGFEDLRSSSWDQDYNDFVVFVGGVKSVPEPASIALIGLGLLGMTAARRRAKTSG